MKKIYLIMLLAASAMMIASCGSNSNNNGDGTEAEEQKEEVAKEKGTWFTSIILTPCLIVRFVRLVQSSKA